MSRTATYTRTETLRERLHALVMVEQERAASKHGTQVDVPLGFGGEVAKATAEAAKIDTDLAFQDGTCTWRLIIREEVLEAFAEEDPNKAAAELIQAAAMCHSALEALVHQHPDVTLPPGF